MVSPAHSRPMSRSPLMLKFGLLFGSFSVLVVFTEIAFCLLVPVTHVAFQLLDPVVGVRRKANRRGVNIAGHQICAIDNCNSQGMELY
jgi:hypothetical protein